MKNRIRSEGCPDIPLYHLVRKIPPKRGKCASFFVPSKKKKILHYFHCSKIVLSIRYNWLTFIIFSFMFQWQVGLTHTGLTLGRDGNAVQVGGSELAWLERGPGQETPEARDFLSLFWSINTYWARYCSRCLGDSHEQMDKIVHPS